MKKLLLLMLPLAAMVLYPMTASAAPLTITAPTVASDTPLVNDGDIQGEINTASQTLQDNLNNNFFSKFTHQVNLARGIGNANNAAANAATNQGYQNYDLFSVQAGFMLGGAIPSVSSNIMETVNTLNDIKENGDMYAGFGTGFALNVGINGSLLVKDLYISGKFGMLSGKKTISSVDLEAEQFLLGVGLNYGLIDEIGILAGLARWRGISVGTGLMYHSNSTMVGIRIKDYSQPFTAGPVSGNLNITNITPTFSVDTKTFTIPVDIATSIQALWLLNASVGAGVDFNITSSENTLGVKSNIGITGTGFHQTAAGSMVAKASSKSKSGFFDTVNPRLSASLGLNFSIIKLELPVVYYPFTKSGAVGLQAGVVW